MKFVIIVQYMVQTCDMLIMSPEEVASSHLSMLFV